MFENLKKIGDKLSSFVLSKKQEDLSPAEEYLIREFFGGKTPEPKS